jgi:hypothetical protein
LSCDWNGLVIFARSVLLLITKYSRYYLHIYIICHICVPSQLLLY